MKEITSATSVLDLIYNTPVQGLLMLSLFILPAILASWVYLMNQLKLRPKVKLYMSVFVLLAYVTGVIFIKKSTSRKQEFKYAESRIIDYLQAKHFFLTGFNEARDRIDGIAGYSDEFLSGLAYYSDPLVLIDIEPKPPYYDTWGLRFKDYNQQTERYNFAIGEIKNYLLARNQSLIGLEAVREKINPTYPDSFLQKLIGYSPDIVPAKLKPLFDNDSDTIGLEVIKFDVLPKTDEPLNQ